MQDLDRVIDTLNSVRSLPTLPVVMDKIMEAVRDPNMDARSLARLIEDDQAIMSRILKVVNSALYAGSVEIDTIHQAVTRLGMQAISNIALSTSVLSAFKEGPGEAFDRKAFWRHSICVGIAACVLVDHATALKGRVSKEKLRLIGLLHDVGKLIMDQYMAEDFHAALSQSRTADVPLHEAEREVVGIDHASVGGWLCGKWKMSEDLMLPILWHHDPDSSPDEYWELTALCHVANYICNREKIGDGGNPHPVCVQAIWKRLGLSVGDIAVVVDAVNEHSGQSDIFMALA